MRIEHVFGSTDPMPTGGQSAREVESEQNLEEKQARSLPRENEWTFEPESGRNEQISEVAEEEKILRTILSPVNGRPDHYPRGPQHLQPEWNPHDGVIVSAGGRGQSRSSKSIFGQAKTNLYPITTV